jgi:hypothetical protein
MAEAVGFWSYVRQDDDGDHGRIKALADDLREQYRIQTAEDLELFVDRESIEWGAAWKERIDTAIAGTTFFISIITPSYIRSPECRRELLKFAREAEKLGLTQLLMSVHWVTVADLETNAEASEDELIRLVAQYNWLDLRDERLEERDSSAYRKAVVALAKKLAERGELARQVADAPAALAAGSEADLDDEDSPGVIDSLVTTEEAIPQAGTLLSKITVEMESSGEIMREFGERVEDAGAQGKGMKFVLVLTNQLAHDLSDPSSAIGKAGREYREVLTDLDPAIHTQLDFIESQGVQTQDHQEYLQEIVGLWEASQEAQSGFESVLVAAESASSFSRSLKRPLKDMRSGMLAVLDGNAIIEEWGRKASELLVKGGGFSEEPHDEDERDGSS